MIGLWRIPVMRAKISTTIPSTNCDVSDAARRELKLMAKTGLSVIRSRCQKWCMVKRSHKNEGGELLELLEQ